MRKRAKAGLESQARRMWDSDGVSVGAAGGAAAPTTLAVGAAAAAATPATAAVDDDAAPSRAQDTSQA